MPRKYYMENIRQFHKSIRKTPITQCKNGQKTSTFYRAQMANKFMERYTDSLVTREIKATIKTRATNINKSGSIVRVGEAVDHIFISGGSINWPDHFRKVFGITP